MAKRSATALQALFQGRWRVVELEGRADELSALEDDAFIEFAAGRGTMRIMAITASLDVRYGSREGDPVAEFSWQGVGAGELRSGRGWAATGTAGRLVGHVFVHDGDDAGFVCEPWY